MTDNERKIRYIVYILVVVFVSLRIFFLENDLPAFGVGLYQPKDEGRYSMMALNYVNYNSVYVADEFGIYTPPTFRVNLIQNIFQVLTMTFFGKNYIGFRMPFVIISLINIVLLLRLTCYFLEKYDVTGKMKTIFFVFMALVLVADFSILLSSKCAESSSMRALTVTVALYIMILGDFNHTIRNFVLGFGSVISMFFVYLTNISLIIAVSVLMLYYFFKRETKKGTSILLGLILGVILSEIYYIKYWDMGAFQNLFASIGGFSDRIVSNANEEIIFIKIINGCFSLFSCNNLFFNIFLLVMLVYGIFVLIFKMRNKFDEKEFFLIIIFGAYLIQCALIDDYNERKSLTIMPVMLLIGLVGTICWVCNKETTEKKYKYAKISSILMAIICCFFSLNIRDKKNYLLDFELMDIVVWVIIIALVVFLLSVDTIFSCHKSTILIAIIAVICMNLYFDVKYVYNYKLYTEKQAMIEIGEIIGEEYVIAPYAIDFCLYNNIKPVSNEFDTYRQLIELEQISFLIDYSGGYNVKKILPEENFETVLKCERSIKCLGEYWPISVFKECN